MSLEALLERLLSEPNGHATPATPPTNHVLQREALRHKAATPATPQNSNELRRAKVLADLRAHPAITYAADVDGDGDPVTIMLAVRGVGSCVLKVEAARWNPLEFLALLDRPRANLGAAP